MVRKYSLVIGIALVTLIVAYQISWIISVKKQSMKIESKTEQNGNASTNELLESDVNLNQNLIVQDTTVIIESYDADGDLISREVTNPDAELIGKDRLDMMVYANEYKSKAGEEERMNGLERMVVQAFSSDSVTLVKYYGEPIDEPGYWIAVRDNIVIVYTEDRSEIYEFTKEFGASEPISAQEVQYDLVDGIYVNNERELFDFLQTYSS